MKFFSAVLFIFLTGTVCFSVNAEPDKKDPIHIFSDEKMVFDQNKLQVSAYENAVLTQGADSIKADEIHGYFKEAKVRKENGSRYELERIKAIGHVKIISPGKLATADYGTYYVDKEQVILENNVVISDGENEAKGAYGVMDRNKGTTQIYSCKPGQKHGKKQRVKALLSKGKDDTK